MGQKDILQSALHCFTHKRVADTHKGDYGKVLVIAGSVGMTGATCLCGKAALHMGAGLVYLAAPGGLISTYECLLTEAVKLPVGKKEDLWFCEAHYGELLTLSKGKDVVVIGPGLGSRPETAKLIRSLLQTPDFAPDAAGIIVDADGLNAWAQYLPELTAIASKRLVLTPHEGEFARLSKQTASEIHSNRERMAADFAQKLSGATVILKGAQTIITNGEALCVNTTGNPGMATGGSGDVLAGMLAGLVATEGKKEDLYTLCTYGVALHGHCGDLAAAKYGERFITAGCLIEEMGALCHDAR
ncbi:MAG: NAD(P)H-hydrate dehydratase [Clostridia bacterium]|nr:NAD(P)H-hydrate dehydratase [Clostridia bacterium]